MQVNSDVTLRVGDRLVELLSTLAGQTEQRVIETLLAMTTEPVAKVRDPNFQLGWASKMTQFPGTPVFLKVKAKFKHHYRNVKLGGITCTFELSQANKKDYKEDDIVQQAAESYLLGATNE